jgi:hypothetical protein
MSAVLLCRQPDAALDAIGALGRNQVAVGVNGAGVLTFDCNTLVSGAPGCGSLQGPRGPRPRDRWLV